LDALVPDTLQQAGELLELACATQVYGLAIALQELANPSAHGVTQGSSDVWKQDERALDLFLQLKDAHPWFWQKLRCALLEANPQAVSPTLQAYMETHDLECSPQNACALLALA
jgi:hypothetical protein